MALSKNTKKEESSRPSIVEKIVPVLVVLSIGLAFMVGVLWQKVSSIEKGNVAGTNTDTQQGQPVPAVSLDVIKGLFDKDLVKFGDANRKVLFVEIADPSCPFCHAASGDNPELSKVMGAQFQLVSDGGTYQAPVKEMRKLVDAGKASFVYLYSPGHGSGEMAMKSLYCANEKGKFWEAHDLVMSNKGYMIQNGTDASGAAATGPVVKNDKTKSQDLANFLSNAVDASFMKSCLDSGKYDDRLAADQQIASTLGYQGTPDFFVNATNFGGAVNFTSMQSVVDSALK